MASSSSSSNNNTPFGSPQRFRHAINDINNIFEDPTNNITNREILTACDIIKDATDTINKIEGNNPLFESIIKHYFNYNDFSSYKTTLLRLEEDIFEKQGIEKRKICWLQHLTGREKEKATRPIVKSACHAKSLGIVLSNIPEGTQYAIHDSGYEPGEIVSDIQRVINTGSFFDPAGRVKEGVQYYDGNGVEIPTETLRQMGFGKILKSVQGKLEKNNNMTITITFYDMKRNEITFTSKRDSSFNKVGNNSITPSINNNFIKNTDFFGGNSEKNEWFNNNNKKNDVTNYEKQLIGTLYILCKELGDFLQALYYKLFMGPITTAVCGFTTDNVFAARCLDMNACVCVQEHSKKEYENLGRCIYYSPPIGQGAVDAAKKDTLLKRTIDNNELILANLNDVLEKKYIYLAGEKIDLKIHTQIYDFIEECIASINTIPGILEGRKSIDVDTFEKLCISCMANKIIDDYKVKPSIKSLYPKTSNTNIQSLKDDNLIPRELGPHLISLKTTNVQAERKPPRVRIANGGGRRKMSGGTQDYIIPTNSMTYDVYDMIYKLFVSQFGKSDEETEDKAEEFYDIMLPFLHYVGASPLHENFYNTFIDLFINSKLQDMTIEQFEIIFNEFAMDEDIEKCIDMNKIIKRKPIETGQLHVNTNMATTNKNNEQVELQQVKNLYKTPNGKKFFNNGILTQGSISLDTQTQPNSLTSSQTSTPRTLSMSISTLPLTNRSLSNHSSISSPSSILSPIRENNNKMQQNNTQGGGRKRKTRKSKSKSKSKSKQRKTRKRRNNKV